MQPDKVASMNVTCSQVEGCHFPEFVFRKQKFFFSFLFFLRQSYQLKLLENCIIWLKYVLINNSSFLNFHLSGGDHEMCGEKGSHPWTALALLYHRIPEVPPHHNVRLHHEGAMNAWDRVHRSLHRHHCRIWDWNVGVVNKQWRGDGHCAWWGLSWPAQISLSLNDHQQMFHQHHVCVVCVG